MSFSLGFTISLHAAVLYNTEILVDISRAFLKKENKIKLLKIIVGNVLAARFILWEQGACLSWQWFFFKCKAYDEYHKIIKPLTFVCGVWNIDLTWHGGLHVLKSMRIGLRWLWIDNCRFHVERHIEYNCLTFSDFNRSQVWWCIGILL